MFDSSRRMVYFVDCYQLAFFQLSKNTTKSILRWSDTESACVDNDAMHSIRIGMYRDRTSRSGFFSSLSIHWYQLSFNTKYNTLWRLLNIEGEGKGEAEIGSVPVFWKPNPTELRRVKTYKKPKKRIEKKYLSLGSVRIFSEPNRTDPISGVKVRMTIISYRRKDNSKQSHDGSRSSERSHQMI